MDIEKVKAALEKLPPEVTASIDVSVVRHSAWLGEPQKTKAIYQAYWAPQMGRGVVSDDFPTLEDALRFIEIKASNL